MSLGDVKKFSNYKDVVFFRRKWVWLTAMLILTPVGILIGLTGDVYQKHNNKITVVPKVTRLTLSVGFLVIILIRVVGPMVVNG